MIHCTQYAQHAGLVACVCGGQVVVGGGFTVYTLYDVPL